MLTRLASLFGYAKAPKVTFVMRHPVKGTKALVASRAVKGTVATRAGAALGALVLVPIGVLAWKARSR